MDSLFQSTARASSLPAGISPRPLSCGVYTARLSGTLRLVIRFRTHLPAFGRLRVSSGLWTNPSACTIWPAHASLRSLYFLYGMRSRTSYSLRYCGHQRTLSRSLNSSPLLSCTCTILSHRRSRACARHHDATIMMQRLVRGLPLHPAGAKRTWVPAYCRHSSTAKIRSAACVSSIAEADIAQAVVNWGALRWIRGAALFQEKPMGVLWDCRVS